MRKCGICGEVGHNARTCKKDEQPLPAHIEEFMKSVNNDNSSKETKFKRTIPKMPVSNFFEKEELGASNLLRDKDYLSPNMKELSLELKEIIELSEVKKPLRDIQMNLDILSRKKSIPKKELIYLKSLIDPTDISNERYTLKKKLREMSFRIPKLIRTHELVQLALKRGVL